MVGPTLKTIVSVVHASGAEIKVQKEKNVKHETFMFEKSI